MKALSIQQPWAWLIVHGYKPVENRTWDTAVRGQIAVHAGKKFDAEGYAWVRETFPEIPMPAPEAFDRGGIVGAVTLVDVVQQMEDRFFFGPFGFKLAGAFPTQFAPFRGALGFFDVPIGLVTAAKTIRDQSALDGRAVLETAPAMPSITLDALPETPEGWTMRMSIHLNFGGGKGAASYDVLDGDGRKVEHIGFGYDSRPGGGRGFFLYADEPRGYLTWPKLREAYAALRQA
jgi:hypothetical protein